MVRGITLGFNTDFDPAIGLFNTTNFPGASSDQLTAARATYAVLTGRVATVASTAVLNGDTGKYEELAPSTLEGGYKVFGMFAQDTWRAEAEPHPHGRPPLRHPDAVRPVHQRHVRGDDGEHLRHVGRGRRRAVQQVQLPDAGRHGRRTSAVHPAQEGH